MPGHSSKGALLRRRYQHDAAFERLLRENDVPFSHVACSFEADGRIFDAELVVPGERALAAWLTLRNLVQVTGLWPVILTPSSPSGGLCSFDFIPPRASMTEIVRADARMLIADAEKVPPIPWTFRGRSGAAPEIVGPDTPLEPTSPNFAELFSNSGPFRCHRRWEPGDHWSFYPLLHIWLFPTGTPWEVFAYLPYGGWNEAPYPAEQVTMLRRWNELYGAEIVSLPGAWYELFVARPPRTRHEALQLAAEIQCFGEETIFDYTLPSDEETVECLRTAHYWYFWWD